MLRLAALLSLLICVPASAAGWGTGTFTGKAKSSIGADRPHTDVTIVAKGSRVRVKALKLNFHCGEGLPERLPVRVSSKFVPVKEGAAGGGAMIALKPKVRHGGRTYHVDGTVFLGLRMTTISGTADAYLTDSRDSVVCEDAAIFTAHQR